MSEPIDLEAPWSAEWSDVLEAVVIKDRDGVVFAELVKAHGSAGRVNLEARGRLMAQAPRLFRTLRVIAATEQGREKFATSHERILGYLAEEILADLEAVFGGGESEVQS